MNYQYNCIICNTSNNSDRIRAVCENCINIGQRKMTGEQYFRWLFFNKNRIENNLSLVFWDDNTVGNKDMYCSWGMCSNDVASYPDVDYWKHLGLTKIYDKTRIDIIDKKKHHVCPFDSRLGTSENMDNGCFYTCKIFNNKIKTKDEAIELFDKAINIIINKEN